MTCPTCDAPNPPGARYCQHCGSAFGPPCPHCGATTWPDARYCVECGSPLGNAARAAPDVVATALDGPLALPEERRLVVDYFRRLSEPKAP